MRSPKRCYRDNGGNSCALREFPGKGSGMADGGTPNSGAGIRSVGSSASRSTLWRVAEKILEPADVRLNGGRPWDIRIIDPEALQRALYGGSVGFGEGYLDGLWETDDLE